MNQNSERGQTEATFTFLVPRFRELKNDLLSPSFYVGNLEWKIKVSPKISTEQGRLLGLYLVCVERESDSWSCYVSFELRLLSVRPDVAPVTSRFQHRFSSSKERDCGIPNFMYWCEVMHKSKGYIEENSVTVEAHVHVHTPQDLHCEMLQTFTNQLYNALHEKPNNTDDLTELVALGLEHVSHELKFCGVPINKKNKLVKNTWNITDSPERDDVQGFLRLLHDTLENKKTWIPIDAKKKAEENPEKTRLLENLKMGIKVKELTAAKNNLEKSRNEIAAQLEKANIELETQRSKIIELEKKQEHYDRISAEEKAFVERLFALKDTKGREDHEIDEVKGKVEEKNEEQQLQEAAAELLRNINNACKNAHKMPKVRKSFENLMSEFRRHTTHLQQEIKSNELAKQRLEVSVRTLTTQLSIVRGREEQAQGKCKDNKHKTLWDCARDAAVTPKKNEVERQWLYPTNLKPYEDRQALRAHFERDIQAKEQQAEEKYRGIVKQLHDLEAELDEERKQLTAALTSKQKLEKHIQGMEAYLDYYLTYQLNNFEQEYNEVKAQSQRNCLTDNRTRKTLEIEFLQVTEDLASSERARRAAEAERDELQEEINSTTNKSYLLISEKRRLETRITTLEEELEEEQSNKQLIGDKLNKAQQTITALESKIANLQEQLEVEIKERFSQQKMNRKLEKKLKELDMELEDERRHTDQYKEQVIKVNTRIKALKLQLEKAQEEISKERIQKRKNQQEYIDMLESHESMTREISNLKEKLRHNTGGITSLSSIGSSKRGSIQSCGIGSEYNSTTHGEDEVFN